MSPRKRIAISFGFFLLVIIVGGAIFFYYFINQQEVIPEEETPEVSFDYLDMLKQIFPERSFESLEQRENCVIDDQNLFYCLEQIVDNNFIAPNEEDSLLIVRYGRTFSEKDGRPVFSQEEGLCHVILSVFDKETGKQLTDTLVMVADEGEIAFYNCENQTYILFAGSGGKEGLKVGTVNLLKVEDETFKRVWPLEEDEWDNVNNVVKANDEGITVYRKRYIDESFVCPSECLFEYLPEPGSNIPGNVFVFYQNIYWNGYQCAFFE